MTDKQADRATALRVAAECSVDPRTVARYLAGDAVNMASAMVISDALRRLGMAELVRSGQGPQGRDGLGIRGPAATDATATPGKVRS